MSSTESIEAGEGAGGGGGSWGSRQIHCSIREAGYSVVVVVRMYWIKKLKPDA